MNKKTKSESRVLDEIMEMALALDAHGVNLRR